MNHLQIEQMLMDSTQRIQRLESTLGTLIQWLYGTGLTRDNMLALHEMLHSDLSENKS